MDTNRNTTWLTRALMYRVGADTVPRLNEAVDQHRPAAGVMHTTEGTYASAMDVFRKHFAPHFLVGAGRITQLVPLGMMSAALEHHKGAVETNKWARVQIEVASYSKLEPWLPGSETFDALAALLFVLQFAAGIPLRRSYADDLEGKTTWATESNPRRQHSKWGKEAGWFGHVDIPGNSHWDPGSLKYAVLFNRARQMAEQWLRNFLNSHHVVGRPLWGALPSQIDSRKPESYDWNYDTVVIHHSGPRATIDPKVIQELHRKKNGWNDVGYHFMIDPDGRIYEGRSLLFKGEHVEKANTGKIGILIMGNFQKVLGLKVPEIKIPPVKVLGMEFKGALVGEPTKIQLQRATELILGLKQLFPSLRKLGGHKDFKKSTECPGDALYDLLRHLRAALGLAVP
jgi:hypothetical protein